MITGKYAILRYAHRYHNYHTGYHNLTDDTFAGMSPRCTLPCMTSTAYFIATFTPRGSSGVVTGSGIFSEASPSVIGPSRYTRPLATVTAPTYHEAALALRTHLALEITKPTPLGNTLRQLRDAGMLPRPDVRPSTTTVTGAGAGAEHR